MLLNEIIYVKVVVGYQIHYSLHFPLFLQYSFSGLDSGFGEVDRKICGLIFPKLFFGTINKLSYSFF